MSDNGSKWIDAGNVVIYDTKKDGTKMRDKNGKPYEGGSGTLSIDGKAVRVWVTVRKAARAGQTNVSISYINEQSTNAS